MIDTAMGFFYTGKESARLIKAIFWVLLVRVKNKHFRAYNKFTSSREIFIHRRVSV